MNSPLSSLHWKALPSTVEEKRNVACRDCWLKTLLTIAVSRTGGGCCGGATVGRGSGARSAITLKLKPATAGSPVPESFGPATRIRTVSPAVRWSRGYSTPTESGLS